LLLRFEESDQEILTNVAEILQIRKGMWAAVAARLHTPIKIFPFGNGSTQVMLYGTVAYTLKDGRKSSVSLGNPEASEGRS
jgi:hypothetical protein